MKEIFVRGEKISYVWVARLISCPSCREFCTHPKGRDKYVHRIIKKCRLVAFDQVPEPSEGKRRGNQQQGDDPVKSDHDDRREANGNGDHVQGAINGVAVRTVIMRIQPHRAPRG